VSARYEAVDGAVVTVDREPHGFAINCTQCGFVMGSPSDDGLLDQDAEHHAGWHDAEHAREQSYR
jgi:hypothetical protein